MLFSFKEKKKCISWFTGCQGRQPPLNRELILDAGYTTGMSIDDFFGAVDDQGEMDLQGRVEHLGHPAFGIEKGDEIKTLALHIIDHPGPGQGVIDGNGDHFDFTVPVLDLLKPFQQCFA